ncbi:MAG: hypothetical protein AB1898_20170 [Acidobacteriota bacterium]
MSDPFFDACEVHFAFLKSDYGCKGASKQRHSWGERFSTQNKTTGVVVTLENRGLIVLVQLARLMKGEIVMPVGEIRPDTELFTFDLDDLVFLKGGRPGPSPKGENVLLNAVLGQAYNLKTYAGEVLAGNFQVFADLDKVVKQRAKEMAFQKWGAQAEKFGWKR